MLALGLGFATMATAIAFGDAPIAGQFRLTTVIAALIGAALGLIGGLIGSLLGPKPFAGRASLFRGTARSVAAMRFTTARNAARGGRGKPVAVFTPQHGAPSCKIATT